MQLKRAVRLMARCAIAINDFIVPIWIVFSMLLKGNFKEKAQTLHPSFLYK